MTQTSIHWIEQDEIGPLSDISREILIECYGSGDNSSVLRYYEEVLSPGAIARLWGEGYKFGFVLAGDAKVGIISYQKREHQLFLNKLYLYSSCRGHGTGSDAIRILSEIAVEEGADAITLRVSGRNSKAIKMYERNGFRFLEHIEVFEGKLYDMVLDVRAKEGIS